MVNAELQNANPNLFSFQAGKRIKPIFQGQDMLDTADIPFLSFLNRLIKRLFGSWRKLMSLYTINHLRESCYVSVNG